MDATQINAVAVMPALPPFGLDDRYCGLLAMPRAPADLAEDLGTLIRSVTSALNVISGEPSVLGSSRLNLVIATARHSLESATSLVGQTAGGTHDARSDESVDLAQCMLDLASALQAVCGPDIVVELAGCREPSPLWCNRLALENVVLNLAVNARDAMAGGGVLSIATGSSGGKSFVRVADSGVGMSPAVRAHALEPFFTTKQDRGGSGVGLAMVADFVERIEGELRIDSAPGAGTTITVTGPTDNPTVDLR